MGNKVIASVQGSYFDSAGNNEDSKSKLDSTMGSHDQSKTSITTLEPVRRTANSKIITVVIDEHI